MALAGFNHSSMLTDLQHEDYMSPEPFGLMDRSIELQTMESLLNYSTTLTNLLPSTYSDPSSSSSGTNSPTGEFPHQQYSILGFENGENNPCTYSSASAMLSFDYLENYPMLVSSLDANNTRNHAVFDHNSLEASMEDHVAEEQLRWPYSGNAGNDRLFYESDGLLGAIHKRPYMGMDDVQPNKRQCVDAQKSFRPTVCKDPQSLAAKNRRERISERLKVLQELVPNGTKVDLVTMLDKAFHYVKFLQLQVKVLATDEFWPAHGGKAPEVGEVKEAIDAILASHRDANSCPNTTALRTESPKP